MRRRAFLKGAGIVTVAVVGGGVWRACDQDVFSTGEGPSVRALERLAQCKRQPACAGQRGDSRRQPAQHAALALQGQRLRQSSCISTLSRNVGALDPYLREEHIGMGCALENLLLAAPANGYAAVATLLQANLARFLPNREPQLLARVELAPGKRDEDELYNAIPRRHTNRGLTTRTSRCRPDFLDCAEPSAAGCSKVKLFLFTAKPSEQRSPTSARPRTRTSIRSGGPGRQQSLGSLAVE